MTPKEKVARYVEHYGARPDQITDAIKNSELSGLEFAVKHPLKIGFGEKTDYTTMLKINPVCPDCDHGTMQYDSDQTAWTEAKNLVVVPLVCSGCGFGTSIHLEVES